MRLENSGLIANSGILLLGFALGLFDVFRFPEITTDFSFAFLVLLLAMVLVSIDCFVRSRMKDQDQEWLSPNIRNPVSLIGQPIQTGFVGSLALVCMGIGLYINTLLTGVESDSFLLACSGGLGGLLGIIACSKYLIGR